MQKNKKYSMKDLLTCGILGLFVISGLMQGNIFGGKNPVVARVGSSAIKLTDVRKYANLIRLPENIDRNNPQVQQKIFNEALGLIIRRSLVTQECKRLGFVITNEQVVESIKKQQIFWENGKFSRAKFLAHLGKLGISEMEYKSIHKEDLLHSQWRFLLKNAYIIPEHAATTFADAYSQKRSGRYIVIDRNKIVVPKPSNVQLEKFYKDNIDSFKMPQEKIYKLLVLKEANEKIESMLQSQKFSAVEKKYASASIMSNGDEKEINALFPEQLISSLNQLELKEGQNTTIFGAGSKYYAAKLVKIKPAFTPEFSQVKAKVIKEYEKAYRMHHATVQNKAAHRGWFRLSDIKMGNSYLGMPDNVLQMLFKNCVGKISRYDEGDSTYYTVVDSIKPGKNTSEEIQSASVYLQDAIANEVVYAAMSSLKFRYKIKVLV